jgi:hypothetical protein
VIYRVDAAGTGRALYRPPANHAVALTRDAEGRMLVGTESPGRLYRFGSDDRPFAVLDSGLTEIRAVAAAADGVVYAAALNRGDDAGSTGAMRFGSGRAGDSARLLPDTDARVHDAVSSIASTRRAPGDRLGQ